MYPLHQYSDMTVNKKAHTQVAVLVVENSVTVIRHMLSTQSDYLLHDSHILTKSCDISKNLLTEPELAANASSSLSVSSSSSWSSTACTVPLSSNIPGKAMELMRIFRTFRGGRGGGGGVSSASSLCTPSSFSRSTVGSMAGPERMEILRVLVYSRADLRYSSTLLASMYSVMTPSATRSVMFSNVFSPVIGWKGGEIGEVPHVFLCFLLPR